MAEVGAQLLDGASAVADLVFYINSQLRKSLAGVLGDKHGVVAEAIGAALFGGNESFHHTFEELLPPFSINAITVLNCARRSVLFSSSWSNFLVLATGS